MKNLKSLPKFNKIIFFFIILLIVFFGISIGIKFSEHSFHAKKEEPLFANYHYLRNNSYSANFIVNNYLNNLNPINPNSNSLNIKNFSINNLKTLLFNGDAPINLNLMWLHPDTNVDNNLSVNQTDTIGYFSNDNSFTSIFNDKIDIDLDSNNNDERYLNFINLLDSLNKNINFTTSITLSSTWLAYNLGFLTWSNNKFIFNPNYVVTNLNFTLTLNKLINIANLLNTADFVINNDISYLENRNLLFYETKLYVELKNSISSYIKFIIPYKSNYLSGTIGDKIINNFKFCYNYIQNNMKDNYSQYDKSFIFQGMLQLNDLNTKTFILSITLLKNSIFKFWQNITNASEKSNNLIWFQNYFVLNINNTGNYKKWNANFVSNNKKLLNKQFSIIFLNNLSSDSYDMQNNIKEIGDLSKSFTKFLF